MCTLIVISIPILIFANVNVIEYLKGRSQSNTFLHFNQIIISIMLLISVLLVNQFGTTLTSYYSRYRNSVEWQRMEDYYIVPHVTSDSNEYIYENPKWKSLVFETFKTLSEKGGIYADFNHFSNKNRSEYPQEFIKDIRVNVNYVNFHQIKDSNNNQITIPKLQLQFGKKKSYYWYQKLIETNGESLNLK